MLKETLEESTVYGRQHTRNGLEDAGTMLPDQLFPAARRPERVSRRMRRVSPGEHAGEHAAQHSTLDRPCSIQPVR